MAKYIATFNGMELTEEGLKAIYIFHNQQPFNERDYKAWKYDLLEQGKIKFAND